MNLSKLVVAAVSIAAFALVWVPGRAGNTASFDVAARTHRALAHANESPLPSLPGETVEADPPRGVSSAPVLPRLAAGVNRGRIREAVRGTRPSEWM